MAVTVKVERNGGEPIFEVGELVCLDLNQYKGAYPYIVMVTGVGRREGVFQGVVMDDEGDASYKIGTHHTDFQKGSFVKFTGKITMESK